MSKQAKNRWTAFGRSKVIPNRRLLVTGPQRTAEDVVRHLAANHPDFTVASVHPGHIEKPSDAAPAADPAGGDVTSEGVAGNQE